MSALVAGILFRPASALLSIAGPLQAVDADPDVRALLQGPAGRLVASAEGAVQFHAFPLNRLGGSFECGEKRTRAGVANADHTAGVVLTSHQGGRALMIAAEGAPITRLGTSQPNALHKTSQDPALESAAPMACSSEGTREVAHLPDFAKRRSDDSFGRPSSHLAPRAHGGPPCQTMCRGAGSRSRLTGEDNA